MLNIIAVLGYIPVHDIPSTFEVIEGGNDTVRNASEYFFRNPFQVLKSRAIKFIQRSVHHLEDIHTLFNPRFNNSPSSIHKRCLSPFRLSGYLSSLFTYLHTNPDIAVAEERPIEMYRVRRIRLHTNAQIH